MLATLKFPVLGYTEIRLIIKRNYKWLAELIGADLEIEVSENDFVFNNNINSNEILYSRDEEQRGEKHKVEGVAHQMN
jgi:hypothetical protein